jgi:hypothetical protein
MLAMILSDALEKEPVPTPTARPAVVPDNIRLAIDIAIPVAAALHMSGMFLPVSLFFLA